MSEDEKRNAYDAGLAGQGPPASGALWGDYLRGKAAFDAAARSQQSLQSSSAPSADAGWVFGETQTSSAGQGAAADARGADPKVSLAGLAIAAFVIIFLLHLAYVAVMGLIAAVVVLPLTWVLARGRAPSFGRVYVAAACAFVAYSLVTILLSRTIGAEAIRHIERLMQDEAAFMRQLRQNPRMLAPLVPVVLSIQVPGILASGVVLSKLLGRPYAGAGGYVRAVVVTAIALVVTFGVVIFAVSRLLASR
jgi:hypothetical protein